MNNNKDDFTKVFFDGYSQFNNRRVNGKMEILLRRNEFEENLNQMWAIYRRGNVRQIIEYQNAVDQIKETGLRVLRNSDGIHKIK